MFISSVNDTRYPGLQGGLLHDTIADNITSVDWATVPAIRLNVECGMLNSSTFSAWGQIHNETVHDDGTHTVVLSDIPSINGTIGNDTGPGPDTIMVSIDLPIPPNEWSAQWSPGGPGKLHVEAQYAQGPYGNVSSVDKDLWFWASRYAPGESSIMASYIYLSVRITDLSWLL